MVVDLILTVSVITLNVNVLNKHYPIKLFEMGKKKNKKRRNCFRAPSTPFKQ